jgi:phosphonate transport system substrate-binding protein
MVDFVKGLHAKDKDCAYKMAAGETAGFAPITHDAYQVMIDLRKAQTN